MQNYNPYFLQAGARNTDGYQAAQIAYLTSQINELRQQNEQLRREHSQDMAQLLRELAEKRGRNAVIEEEKKSMIMRAKAEKIQLNNAIFSPEPTGSSEPTGPKRSIKLVV